METRVAKKLKTEPKNPKRHSWTAEEEQLLMDWLAKGKGPAWIHSNIFPSISRNAIKSRAQKLKEEVALGSVSNSQSHAEKECKYSLFFSLLYINSSHVDEEPQHQVADPHYMWYETITEMNRLYIVIRKPRYIHFEVNYISREEQVVISAHGGLTQEEFSKMSACTGIPEQMLKYRFPPLHKATTIHSPSPLLNTPVTHLQTEDCIVVSYPFSNSNPLKFE